MLNELTAVEVLRALRPKTAVRCAHGTGEVMCQIKNHVVLLLDGYRVVQVERFECEEVCS